MGVWLLAGWLALCCYWAYGEYRWQGGSRTQAFLMAFCIPLVAPYIFGKSLAESLNRRKRRAD